MNERKRALQAHDQATSRMPWLPLGRRAHRQAGDAELANRPAMRPIRSAPALADLGGETMTLETILQFRGRIAAGVYDNPAVIQALAEALLASGEV